MQIVIVVVAILGNALSHYTIYRNAAIQGHNNIPLSNVLPEDCARRCNEESSFICRSFDYDKNTQQCNLSDKDKDMVGGLRTDYTGDPYDHYERGRFADILVHFTMSLKH